MKHVATCIFSAVLGSLLTVWITEQSASRYAAQAQDERGSQLPTLPAIPPAQPRAPAAKPLDAPRMLPSEAAGVAVYELCNRAVVNITTRSVRNDNFFLLESPDEGSGSGAVIDNNGHILTNYHVIEDARQVAVTLYDGTTHDAKFVGADPINDLAVIRVEIEKEKLFPVTFGDSEQLKVGMHVFAIGNPFGLERTMTTGIVSSLNRSLQVRANRSIRQIIQIDAAVNPGNSGGPLLNTSGRLIGINTAIASRNGQSAGVGFAIPINLAKRVVPQLIKHGRVIRPDIGISKVYETEEGLLIAKMTRNGPAERAGLRGPRLTRERRGVFVVERIDRSAADLIVAVDGEETKTADDFLSYIESRPIGSQVELTVVRENRRVIVKVTLGQSD